MLFRKKQVVYGSPEFIVAGLGNPGKKYELTRHNAGFIFMDMIADKYNLSYKTIKFKSVSTVAQIGSHKCLLMKPQTFMNESGQSIREASAFYKIPPEKIIIIFDDISLDCGKMRIRRKGSDGGHNGIKSVIYNLNSDNFPRIKLGIGKKTENYDELADWVLSKFTQADLKDLLATCEDAVNALELMLSGSIDDAMSKYNS